MSSHIRTSPSRALSQAQYSRDVARSMSEDELQGHILEAGTALRWHSYHTFDARHSAAGFPDLVMVNEFQRRVLFSELKRQTERQSPAQRVWERLLRAVGPTVHIEYYLWRPSDWLDGTITRLLQSRAA
jgi:hypothetical protein